jgi:hypothetical protein
MVKKTQEAPRKPSVVYDLKMPAYGYRDDRGQSRTVDVDGPKVGELKLTCLANLGG